MTGEEHSAAFVPESTCRCASGHHTCGLPNPEEELILALARIEELKDVLRDTEEEVLYALGEFNRGRADRAETSVRLARRTIRKALEQTVTKPTASLHNRETTRTEEP